MRAAHAAHVMPVKPSSTRSFVAALSSIASIYTPPRYISSSANAKRPALRAPSHLSEARCLGRHFGDERSPVRKHGPLAARYVFGSKPDVAIVIDGGGRVVTPARSAAL